MSPDSAPKSQQLADHIQKLFEKNGPDPQEYSRIFELVDQLDDLQIEDFRQAMKPILNPNSIIGFSFAKHFVYLIKKYYEFLNPKGELIIGNFNVQNPSRRIMEILGDWFLYHRSEDELRSYALQAGIEAHKIEVFKEPLGINLFLRVKK